MMEHTLKEDAAGDDTSMEKVTTSRPPAWVIISLLGALSVVSPFSIDMYLPAFSKMAADLNTTSPVIALTLSSYFIGLAIGQIFYGPFLDRFGRKRPLFFGLSLFTLTSLACVGVRDVNTLIILRFVQALGGCAAGVGATAMVRDFFPAKESAKIFSLLFLFIGVSPLLAPSVGSLVVLFAGWKMIFVLLTVVVSTILLLTYFYLPEGHQPDPTVSLRLKPILLEFFSILKNPCFLTYSTSGAFSFAGLFTYVAGSPIIFMDGYHLDPAWYGGVFALLTMGFIGGNQVNVALLKKYTSQHLFSRALVVQTVVALIFWLGTYTGVFGFVWTLVLFFVFLSCAGITYPNAAALALSPFTKNVGSASALLGFLQMGVGALISTAVGMTKSHDSLPIISILAGTTVVGLVIRILGKPTRSI